MKKTLIIQLTDGSQRVIDLQNLILKNKLPLNITANDQFFANLATHISTVGFLDEDKTDTNNLTWVGASQVAKVEIKFTKL